jgi:hypothetical protein
VTIKSEAVVYVPRTSGSYATVQRDFEELITRRFFFCYELIVSTTYDNNDIRGGALGLNILFETPTCPAMSPPGVHRCNYELPPWHILLR